MSEQQMPFPLRMPAELREALEKSAKVNRRSLNSELLLRLEQSLGGMHLGAEAGPVLKLPVIDLLEWPKHPAETDPLRDLSRAAVMGSKL
jgi:hypothetical protein